MTPQPAAHTVRLKAAHAVVRALRTSEITAARVAARYLSTAPQFVTQNRTFAGFDAVLDRLSGQWAMGPTPSAGTWLVTQSADGCIAQAEFPGLGAAPAKYLLAFEFDDQDRISSITERIEAAAAIAAKHAMTPAISRRLDRALAEGKPVVVAYVDDDGETSLSLRGSLQTYSETQLCMWVRKPTGGIVSAIQAGRGLTFLYRDNATRTTLIGKGRGQIVTDDRLRAEIFEMTPEVEQRHDPGKIGAAVIVDLTSMRGTSPEGVVDLQFPRKCEQA